MAGPKLNPLPFPDSDSLQRFLVGLGAPEGPHPPETPGEMGKLRTQPLTPRVGESSAEEATEAAPRVGLVLVRFGASTVQAALKSPRFPTRPARGPVQLLRCCRRCRRLLLCCWGWVRGGAEKDPALAISLSVFVPEGPPFSVTSRVPRCRGAVPGDTSARSGHASLCHQPLRPGCW